MIWNIRKERTFKQNNKNRKEAPQNEDRVRSLWDNFKCTNIRISGARRRRERARN